MNEEKKVFETDVLWLVQIDEAFESLLEAIRRANSRGHAGQFLDEIDTDVESARKKFRHSTVGVFHESGGD